MRERSYLKKRIRTRAERCIIADLKSLVGRTVIGFDCGSFARRSEKQPDEYAILKFEDGSLHIASELVSLGDGKIQAELVTRFTPRSRSSPR